MTDTANEKSPGAPINADRPKRRLSEDRLGYAGFARAVARSIQSVPSVDGIVMAIHGPWGSGKTSAVNMVVDALSDTADGQTILVVRFNPWWFSEQEDLTRAFFAEVSAALGPLVSDKVRDGFKTFAKRLNSAKKIIGTSVAFLPGVAGLKEIIENGLEALGDLAGEDTSLDKARNDLRDALINEGKRILVIIDDVDRLPDDEARQIFRMVKSVADLPNVIYMLVFDREVARGALRNPSSPAGPEWLEKIVQVSFDLPSVHPTDLAKLFTDELGRIVGANVNVDPIRWPNIFHRAISPWLRTPRDVARALNAIATTWPVVGTEVDMADLVALEVLRTFEPTAYDYVRRGIRELTGVSANQDKRNSDWYDRLIAAFGEPHRAQGQEALKELFPRLMSVWGNMHYDASHIGGWDKARRVAVPRRFPTYFTYGVGPDVFSQPELDELLRSVSSAGEFGVRIRQLATEIRSSGESRAALVLEELQNVPESAGNAEIATSTLLEMGDAFIPANDQEATLLNIPMSWRLGWAVEAQLRRLPQSKRFKLVKQAVDASPSLATVGFTVEDLVREHDSDTKHPVAEADRLINTGQVEQLKRALAKRFAKESQNPTFIEQPQLLGHLYRWARADSFSKVKAWTKKQMASDEGVLLLAKAATTYSHVHGYGDTTSVRVPLVQAKSLVDIVDLDALKKKVAKLAKHNDLRSDQGLIIADFTRGCSTARFD